MKTLNVRKLTSPLLAVLFTASIAHADDRSMNSQQRDERRGLLSTSTSGVNSIARATQAYRTLTQDRKVPSSVLKNAKCVAIIPETVTAALGVGGTHGNGIGFCKNPGKDSWSNPVYLDLTGGSLGLQAGVKSADLVLFITGDNARSALQNGTFKLSGDFSAVAGSYDESYVAPPSGVIAYANNGGVFAGASLVGVSLTPDKDEQSSVYGASASKSIFEGTLPPTMESSVNELRNLLPSI